MTIAPYLHLGGACPPHWVFKDLLYLVSLWHKWQVGGGGWWDHPPILATLGKMALGTSVDFSALGSPTSPVSRRVVRLTVSHYYCAIATLKERLWGRNLKPCRVMIPSTGSGSGIGGRGMHNGCDFWN